MEYDLKTAVQRIADKLATHVGAGDNEHAPVDRQHSGFMTPQMYIRLFESIGYRTQLPNGSDMYALNPGHFVGAGLLNGPKGDGDTSTFMVDVYEFKQFDKQIFAIDAATGELYELNRHTSTDSDGTETVNKFGPSGWVSINRYAVLWQGNLADTTTKAVFDDSADKFKYLRITTNNQNGSIKSTVVQNAQEITVGDIYVTNDQQSAIIFNARLFVTGASAQLEYSHAVDVKSSGTAPHAGAGISIVKIEGVM